MAEVTINNCCGVNPDGIRIGDCIGWRCPICGRKSKMTPAKLEGNNYVADWEAGMEAVKDWNLNVSDHTSIAGFDISERS